MFLTKIIRNNTMKQFITIPHYCGEAALLSTELERYVVCPAVEKKSIVRNMAYLYCAVRGEYIVRKLSSNTKSGRSHMFLPPKMI